MTTKSYNLNDFPRLASETNDIGRLTRAISDVPEGGQLIIPPDNYVFDSISIKKEITIIFEGTSNVIATAVNKDIFTIEGTCATKNYKLSVAASRRDIKVTLTVAPSDLQPGDLVVLTDDSTRFGDRQTDVNTEIHEVDSIDGADVYFKDFVRLDKTPAASGVNLYKINPISGVRIYNFNYRLPEGSTSGNGIYANYVRDLYLENISGFRGAGSLVQIRKSYNTIINRFRYTDPQVTGSGQGYGVQFYGGNTFGTVRDGYTRNARHSVDFDSSFDMTVVNVVDVKGVEGSFIMSHNGWTADITFSHCRSINGKTGFSAFSQGTADPLSLTYHNFHILHCEVIMKAAPGSSCAGVHFYSPCKNVSVRNTRVRYGNGNEGSSVIAGTSTAGIRMFPASTEVMIESCRVEGCRRALHLGHTANYTNDSRSSHILVRDFWVKRCTSGFFMDNGDKRIVHIFGSHLDSIYNQVFEISANGTFSVFTIDGMTISNSDNATMFTNVPQKYSGEAIKGCIRNISTDRAESINGLPAGWTLTNDNLYLEGDCESINLTGNGTASATKGKILPDGIVEGQKLFIVSPSGTNWTLHAGSNILFGNGATSATIGNSSGTVRGISLVLRNRATSVNIGNGSGAVRGISLVWRNNATSGYWFQVT